jgi:hypothetical protein
LAIPVVVGLEYLRGRLLKPRFVAGFGVAGEIAYSVVVLGFVFLVVVAGFQFLERFLGK